MAPNKRRTPRLHCAPSSTQLPSKKARIRSVCLQHLHIMHLMNVSRCVTSFTFQDLQRKLQKALTLMPFFNTICQSHSQQENKRTQQSRTSRPINRSEGEITNMMKETDQSVRGSMMQVLAQLHKYKTPINNAKDKPVMQQNARRYPPDTGRSSLDHFLRTTS